MVNDGATTSQFDFSLIGDRVCLDYSNTVSWHPDGLREERLRTFNDLVSWADAVGVLSGAKTALLKQAAHEYPKEAATALSAALRMRGVIHRLFTSLALGQPPESTDLSTLNNAIRRAWSAVLIASVGKGDVLFERLWGHEASDFGQILRPVVADAGDLLLSPQLVRVHTCANKRCGWLFVDTSRNQMRRWCEMRSCGNRAKSRRHYSRNKPADAET